MRIIFAADLHLSPTHRYFVDNWHRFVEIVNEAPPDLVVLGGDLTFNGADHDGDLGFAASEIARLEAPVRILAGNHDVGERPGSKKVDQPVNPERLARFHRRFPDDRWHLAEGDRHLVGINSELLQVDLPETRRQWEWLAGVARAIRGAGKPRQSGGLILFTHRPLFERDVDERSVVGSAVDPVARDRLLDLLVPAGLALVVSGHVHVFRTTRVPVTVGPGSRSAGSVEYVWAPSFGFTSTHPAKETFGGEARIGYLEIETDPAGWTLVEPETFVGVDMRNWFASHKTTITMPPWPP